MFDAVDVLAGYGLIGADVDHVDAWRVNRTQMFDRQSNHSRGDQGLPQTNLVGNQKPAGTVRSCKQPLERSVSRPLLKILQPAEHILH